MTTRCTLCLACCVALPSLAHAQGGSDLPRSQPKQIQANPAGTIPPSSRTRFPNPGGMLPPPRPSIYLYPPGVGYPLGGLMPAQNPGYGVLLPTGPTPTPVPTIPTDFDPLNNTERFDRTLDPLNAGDQTMTVRNFAPGFSMDRQQQMSYQYGGFNSLNDSWVQSRLKLTPEQIKDLRGQIDWSEKRTREINLIGATEPEKGMKLYREYWDQRRERLGQFLTPEQRKVWSLMSGEAFSTPQAPPPSSK